MGRVEFRRCDSLTKQIVFQAEHNFEIYVFLPERIRDNTLPPPKLEQNQPEYLFKSKYT